MELEQEQLEDKSVLNLSRDLGFFMPKEDRENLDDNAEFLGLGKRGKRRRQLRKQGLSRKEARKQTREELGRTKVGSFLNKAGKKVGQVVKVGALAIPRNAFLLLCKINYRGWADKFNVALQSSSYEKKLRDKWEKLGGRFSVLKRNINMGVGKKPLLCGRKCKKRVEEWRNQAQTESFVSFNAYEFGTNEYNYPTGVEEAGVGTTVASASVITGALTTLINEASKSFVDNAGENIGSALADTLLDPSGTGDMPPPQDTQAYLEREILQNPSLTSEQKQQAVADLRSSLGGGATGGMNNTTKYALIGGGVLVLGLIVYAIAKK